MIQDDSTTISRLYIININCRSKLLIIIVMEHIYE